ncbi:MAG: sigma-54-dependent Fis family transcriptional regulator [Gemmatimonadales bacterium]|nr:sigma-54-dependent Fis family transcriptional regulator [Gemmatimonadales bacterium]
MTLVLVVDDAAPLAEQYAYDLRRMGDYEVLVAGGGAQALELLGGAPVDCVILDLEMPGMDGFEVLRALERRGSQVPVVVYTGTGNYDRCIQAVRLGAYGFIDKAEPMERVVHEIETALERRRLRSELSTLRRQLGRETSLIGGSAPMEQMRETIARVAPVPSPVLILGESGTGKELVARDLHRFGPNPSGPFVPLNSAALPESLVESELFGHERGAFTGAIATRKGAFEAAERGTLFLDEIGELPLSAQAKLLRVLEERQVTRLGGNRTVPVTARIVAATNRDLETEIAAGRFREDLFFRLNVHVVRLPPLRDRLSDIPALADQFLTGICSRFGIRKKKIAPDALDLLMKQEWRRNNVRELRNVIERMIIASDGDTIGPGQVPLEIRERAGEKSPAEPGRQSLQEQKAEAERRILLAALERNQWHVTRTAEELGLADHASLLKILRRHHIRRPD